MEVQKGKVPVLGVGVHDDSLYCVDGAVILRGGVDVAPIEVNAVDIDSEVSSGHAIRVEDWEDIEDEVISEDSA
jgi:hypothetical protein